MISRTLYIEGIGFSATGLADWPTARAAFRGEPISMCAGTKRPSPALLPPAERRRAPDSVALALEVASQAIAQSGLNAADVQSVFTSAHGDLTITDTMCATLVDEPLLISPTKFHNSVHNAAAGYWTIGTGCMAPGSALSAFDRSFAAGFVEAASQCAADDCPVLLVGYDIEACGALVSVTASRGVLAVALVLSPMANKRTRATITWSLQPGPVPATPGRSAAALRLQHNAFAGALPLFEALACESAEPVVLPLSPSLGLYVAVNTNAIQP